MLLEVGWSGGSPMILRSLVHALMVLVAVVLVGGRHPSEAAESPQQLKAACENGTPRACLVLATIYAKGMEGTEKRTQ